MEMFKINPNFLSLSKQAIEDYFETKSEPNNPKKRLVLEFDEEHETPYLGCRKLTRLESILASLGKGPAAFSSVLEFAAGCDLTHRQFDKEITAYNQKHKWNYLKKIPPLLQERVMKPNTCDPELDLADCNQQHQAGTRLQLNDADLGEVEEQSSTSSSEEIHDPTLSQELAVLSSIEDSEDIDSQDQNGDTIMHKACRTGDIDLFDAHLKTYPNLHLKNNAGRTSLHEAGENANFDMIIRLVKHDAIETELTGEKQSLLHLVSKKGDSQLLKFLADRNFAVDAMDENGYTPLHIAALHDNNEAMTFLLMDYPKPVQGNPFIDTKDRSDKTALHHAIEHACSSAASTLVMYGADLNIRDKDGNTPLHIASRQGALETVEMLVQNDAKCNLPNGLGKTAYQVALDEGHNLIAEFLKPKTRDEIVL